MLVFHGTLVRQSRNPGGASAPRFGIKRGLMTTCHAMTASQPTVDGTSKKEPALCDVGDGLVCGIRDL